MSESDSSDQRLAVVARVSQIGWRGATVAAVLGGVIWASLSLVRGATWVEFGTAAAASAATLWLVLFGVGSLLALGEARYARPMLALAACLLPLTYAFGHLLVTHTNHRPLGAVTFALCVFALSFGLFTLVRGLKLTAVVWVALAVSVSLVALPIVSSGDVARAIVIELLVGAVAGGLGLFVSLKRPALKRVSGLLLPFLLLANAWIIWSQALHSGSSWLPLATALPRLLS